MISAYKSGEYPDWLQKDMDRCLPRPILERFARKKRTSQGGHYYFIHPRDLAAIKAALEALGY
jgi:hypothetical protein